MKIFLVHNSYLEPGGEDVVFQRESQLLKSAGHEVLEYRRSNLEIERYSWVRRLGLLSRSVWAYDTRREFRDLLHHDRPDIVHVHNTFLMISPSIYSACRDQNVPVVQTLHNYRLLCPAASFFRDGKPCEDCVAHGLWCGIQHGCYRDSRMATASVAIMLAVHRKRKTWVQMVDRYIALTKFARSKFVNAGFPRDKITVKPNFAYPDPGKRTCDGSYALFVGRLSPEKGIYTLLDAWCRSSVDVALRIIGDGPSSAQLQSRVAASATKKIVFMGQVRQPQVISAMKEARFLVFPSEQYENFPLTIAEAFACTLPVIASDLGAMREIVTDGQTGLLFRAGDPEDLARKLAGACAHPEQMRQLGKQARVEYENKYSADANYHMLMDIYHKVIDRFREHELPSCMVSGEPFATHPSQRHWS
jgi:glycosyltransferase involved in cell wall biosynthesis